MSNKQEEEKDGGRVRLELVEQRMKWQRLVSLFRGRSPAFLQITILD